MGGYAHACRAGRCRILSLAGPAPDGGRARLSTAELAWRGEDWTVRQHRGRKNSAPPPEAAQALARYVALLTDAALPVDREALKPMADADAASRAAGYDVAEPSNVEAVLRIWDALLPRGLRGRTAGDWAALMRAHARSAHLVRGRRLAIPDGTEAERRREGTEP